MEQLQGLPPLLLVGLDVETRNSQLNNTRNDYEDAEKNYKEARGSKYAQ